MFYQKQKGGKYGLRAKCRVCARSECRKYRIKNIQKERKRVKRWQKENKHITKEWAKKYYWKNNAKMLEAKSRQRIRKHSTFYLGLCREYKKTILVIYDLRTRITKCTGIKFEVDHIHPLFGKDFCGLHAPWNLQVIPAAFNRKKGNKLL